MPARPVAPSGPPLLHHGPRHSAFSPTHGTLGAVAQRNGMIATEDVLVITLRHHNDGTM